MTHAIPQFPLHPFEEVVMQAERRDMPQTLARLEARGLMKDGRRTPEGEAVWRDHCLAKGDDAIRRNVIPNISALVMIVLGKLISGEALTDDEMRGVRASTVISLIDRTRDGFRITPAGRRAYALAAGRT